MVFTSNALIDIGLDPRVYLSSELGNYLVTKQRDDYSENSGAADAFRTKQIARTYARRSQASEGNLLRSVKPFAGPILIRYARCN